MSIINFHYIDVTNGGLYFFEFIVRELKIFPSTRVKSYCSDWLTQRKLMEERSSIVGGTEKKRDFLIGGSCYR